MFKRTLVKYAYIRAYYLMLQNIFNVQQIFQCIWMRADVNDIINTTSNTVNHVVISAKILSYSIKNIKLNDLHYF